MNFLISKKYLSFYLKIVALLVWVGLLSVDNVRSTNLASLDEAVAQQAAKINLINDIVSETNTGRASSDCSNCQPDVTTINYMQCSEKNSYLHQEVDALSSSPALIWKNILSGNSQIQSAIKPICIRISMEEKFGENANTFDQCQGSASSNSNRKRKNVIRPCINNDYFQLINNSFAAATQCMAEGAASSATQKDDARAVFAMITVESGFHVNAVSSSGAGGIGQLTEDSIDGINRIELPKIREHLSKSDDPTCRSLNEDVLSVPMMGAPQYSCDRISIQKGNPLKNMIYTYAHVNLSRKLIFEDLFLNNKYANKFDLSPDEETELLRALAIWSHNTGVAGITTPARALLNREYARKKVTSVSEFLKSLKTYVRNFPASANSSSGRRSETATYYPKIIDTLKNIEKNVDGGTCLK